MSVQLDILTLISEGEALKEKGLAQAVDHANQKIVKWSDRVYEIFKEWLKARPQGFEFMTEDFRLFVDMNSKIEQPPSLRAYGFICPNAAREGLVKYIGTSRVTNPKARRTPASLWVKL